MKLLLLFLALLPLLALAIAWTIGYLLLTPKCKDCDVRMKLREIEDPMGITLFRKLRLFSFRIPHAIEKSYVCPHCKAERVTREISA